MLIFIIWLLGVI